MFCGQLALLVAPFLFSNLAAKTKLLTSTRAGTGF
jgi:hypothetical protein